MSFNFSSLQQKADQVLHNADEITQKFGDAVYGSNPVDFQVYDRNGNLVTRTVETIKMQQQKVDSFISSARGKFPLVNVHPNSRLICSSGADNNGLYIPDDYSYSTNLIDVAELIPVREYVNDPENDRYPIEKEFLDFVFGDHGNYNHYPDFNILHIKTKPKPSGAKWFMWRGITSVPVCTYRAFIKIVSGKLYITAAGVFGATNKWQLIEHHTGSNRLIWDEHRLDSCNEGEVLEYYFAYPAILMGHISLPKSVVTIKQLKTEW